MDKKNQVILATKKVDAISAKLKNSIQKRNIRLAKKYVGQIEECLESFLELLVALEVDGVGLDEPWVVEAKRVEEFGQSTLTDAEEFLVDAEDAEVETAKGRVVQVRLDDLCSSMTSFMENLKTPASSIVEDVEAANQARVVDELITQKREQIHLFKTSKLSICGELSTDASVDLKRVNELYVHMNDTFVEWVEAAVKVCPLKESGVVKSTKAREPGLKLDRLALPTFKGEVREFARFMKEFEATVGVQFSDPKVKVMYLKNQCLKGGPKEVVRGLGDYDEVVARLKERYGRPSLTVDSVLREISELKLIPNDEQNSIIKLCRVLQSAWDDLTAVDSVEEFCNIVTLNALESKLPSKVQVQWAREKIRLQLKSSKESMFALKGFLEEQRKVASDVLLMRGKTDIESSSESKCKFNGALSAEPVKQAACFRCGFTSHKVKDCRVPSTIKCRKCQRVGHIENACPEKVKKEKEVKFQGFSGSDVSQKSGVKLPIEVVNTEVGPCTVLWDSGSMLNLVSNKWASDAGLKGKRCSLKFKVIDGSVKETVTYAYEVCLISHDGVRKVVNAYGIEGLAATGRALSENVATSLVESSGGMVNLSDIFNVESDVELLLGSGCASFFPTIKHAFNDLCLMSSSYGIQKYFVVGKSEDSDTLSHVCHAEFVRITPLDGVCPEVVSHVETCRKEKLLNDFNLVEDLGIRPPPICKSCMNCEVCKPASQFLSLKDYRELSIIKTKLSYDSESQSWTAQYPFLKDPSVLNDNYAAALKALERRESKLLKDEKLKVLYDEQVNDFVERGVISKMTDSELDSWNGPVRYVDHHEVFKEGSTTPLRIVINSSFRHGNELSFNDILMKGPNVLTSLYEILLRWRLYPVAFVGDVSKMYHNVKTGELEGNLRRLLWRNCDQSRAPDVYGFNVVTFGDRPAGCIAVSALKSTADLFSSVSEKAAHVLKEDSYMDDVVSGSNSMSEAESLSDDIQVIASKGGFKFKKFQFSKPSIEGHEVVASEKVLGVGWKPIEDTVHVRVDLNHNKRTKGLRKPPVAIDDIPFTRRICLRLVNGIFDPLGLFSPVVVRLKILMKQHFVESDKYKKWDELLSEDDRAEWIKVLKDVKLLDGFDIPRHCVNAFYPTKDASGKYMLICFSDASGNAMCASIYIRYETVCGVVSVGLLTAKTRVSPSKVLTMPRLELCAALMGARLVKKVTTSIGHDFCSYFLIDSKIVLGILNRCTLENEFTYNCVAEVRNKADMCNFAWVKSENNIADLGSRGTSPLNVSANSEWQRGPSWLYLPVESWPIEPCHFEDLPEVCNLQGCDSVFDIAKFSDLDKLHKHTAICIKFARSRGNGKGKLDSWKNIKITPEEYKAAELYWLKVVSNTVVKLYNAGKLDSLRPVSVWDDKGQFIKIVTSGRLGQLLKIGYDVEELIILDPSHPYTYLVLKHFHDQDHCSDDRTVWKSRNKFWIPQARRLAKKIRSKCYRCRLLVKLNCQQMMSPLPVERVLPTPAWTYTSIDLFGPIEHVDMVRKRMKEKCWGVIFTCMVSRAVHLDLTQGYDTDALLQAIRRFMSLRGCPKELLSDHGSQMIACHKEVAVMLELVDWNLVDGWCSRRGISWKFVPPQGQHMNGVTESLIRVTKDQLKQVITGKRLTFVEIQTVMFEVGQMINCRPLGVYARPGSDPLDGGPITPNHLLLGRATGTIPELKFENVSKVKRMKFLHSVAVEFWDKWRVVAFPSLVPQFKWHKTQRNLQVGDVVLLNDEEARVADYRLGLVIGTKPSKDGLVRSVKVKCIHRNEEKLTVSYLDRPIHKLCCIVPVEEQE